MSPRSEHHKNNLAYSGRERVLENARLSALYSLGILDTEPEHRVQRLADRAARAFRTPMAAIGFVDRDRVWLKAAVGVPVSEVPRGISFCTHTVHVGSLLVVPDASMDARFATHPLVTGDPHIRFYAGAPLRAASGHCVGALCVLDTVPRTLEAFDRQYLEQMAGFVSDELMVRRFVHETC